MLKLVIAIILAAASKTSVVTCNHISSLLAIWMCPSAHNTAILCQLAPSRFRATGYAAGAYLTPLLGKLKDHGTPLSVGFAMCAIPAIIAAILMLMLRPKERDCGVEPAK